MLLYDSERVITVFAGAPAVNSASGMVGKVNRVVAYVCVTVPICGIK
jgi:hypothetical protein